MLRQAHLLFYQTFILLSKNILILINSQQVMADVCILYSLFF